MRSAAGAGTADMPELSTETPEHYTAPRFNLKAWKKKRPVRIQSCMGVNAVHGPASLVIRRRKRSGGSRARLYGFANAHLLPVVAKLLAAIETHDVRAVAMAGSRHLAARRERKRGSLMRTTKQRIQQRR